MEKAASDLDFIAAARFRDELSGLQKLLRSKQ
jgi:excinuclease UvrABC nuclease subunit